MMEGAQLPRAQIGVSDEGGERVHGFEERSGSYPSDLKEDCFRDIKRPTLYVALQLLSISS